MVLELRLVGGDVFEPYHMFVFPIFIFVSQVAIVCLRVCLSLHVRVWGHM